MSKESKEYLSKFVVDRVNQLLSENRIKSKKTLSQLTGHSETLVTNVVNKRNLPSLVSLFDLCDYFGVTLEDFFRVDYSKDKSAGALLKLLTDKYEPEMITQIYDMFENVSPENMEAALKIFSDYRQSKNKKENKRI